MLQPLTWPGEDTGGCQGNLSDTIFFFVHLFGFHFQQCDQFALVHVTQTKVHLQANRNHLYWSKSCLLLPLSTSIVSWRFLPSIHLPIKESLLFWWNWIWLVKSFSLIIQDPQEPPPHPNIIHSSVSPSPPNLTCPPFPPSPPISSAVHHHHTLLVFNPPLLFFLYLPFPGSSDCCQLRLGALWAESVSEGATRRERRLEACCWLHQSSNNK